MQCLLRAGNQVFYTDITQCASKIKKRTGIAWMTPKP